MLMVIVVLIGKGAYDWAQRRYGRFYRLVGFWVFILGVCLADYVGGTKSDPTNPPPCLSAPMGLGAAGICAAPPALLTDGEGAQTNSFRFNSIDRSDDSVVLDLSWNGADFSTSPFIELFSRTNLIIGGWRYVGWLQANPGETNVSVVVDANMLDDDALSPSLFFSARADEGPTYDGTDDDGDGVPNATERARGTNPRRTDSDGDGVPDSEELDFASTGEVIPDFNLSSLADVFADTTTFATYPPATSVNLPFAVEIAGGCSTQAIVHTCGMVTFLDVDSTGNPRTYTYNDTPASLYAGQNAIVSAYGFQFTMLGYFGAELRAGTVYASNGRWFVAEWRNLMDVMEYASLSLGRATFQLAVSEADPTTVHVRYLSLSGSYDGTDAIIGAHGLNGRQGLLVSNGDAGSVSTGMVLTYHWGTGTDPLNPDSDGDGLPDGWEIAYGMNPLVPNGTATDPRFAPDADPDHDHLTNRQESELGTNPFQPDSDGDGMDDGWEVAQGFDPAVHNSQTERTDDDPDADPDGDGLTNRQECEWRTNPNETDSDGDGVPDGTEIAQNSDPADGGDGGQAGSRVPALFTFGDPSSSCSEKYELVITPNAATGSGSAPHGFTWVNLDYGQCETRTAMLMPGWSYSVRIFHAATNLSNGPDYDYQLELAQGTSSEVSLSDPDRLFGSHYSSDTFTGDGLVATVSVYKIDVAICTPTGDDWSELDASRVVLDDENLRIKLTVVPQANDISVCSQRYGDSVTVSTSATCPQGCAVSIAGAVFTNCQGHSEIRLTKSFAQLRALGLLPERDKDGIAEMACLDIGTDSPTSNSNLSDSQAFLGLGYQFRGNANNGSVRGLELTPPVSTPSESFFKAAGAEIVSVSYSGVVAAKRQIMNQADVFYYSGHGDSSTGKLKGPGTSGYGLSPTLVSDHWGRDQSCVVFSACSVLDINDYNGNFNDPTGGHSHGMDWEAVGAPVMLGYNYIAPGDAGGTPERIIRAWLANRGRLGDVNAWMEANCANRAWNACAIVKDEKYVYVKDWGFTIRTVKEVPRGEW